MMKFASGIAALVAATECGPEVVKDGHFPTESRAMYKTYTTVDYADLFEITYSEDNFKVLNNVKAKEQYVLTMCKSEAPTDDAVDKVAALPSDYTARKHFTVPLASYGSDSTATLAFLDIIDVHDRQLYISQYATAPCLQKAMECDATMKAASAWGDDAEKLLRQQQINNTEGFFVDGASSHPNSIAVSTAHDPHLLNRAEWIKIVAAFFNFEDKAEKYMKDEETRWAASVKEGAAASTTPLVAFISKSDYGTFGSDGSYIISLATYKTLLVTDAGGRSFTTADMTSPHAVAGYQSIDFNASNPDAVTAFLAEMAKVDAFIDETYAWDPKAYTQSSFEATFGFQSAHSAKAFRLDGLISGGNGLDWFEGSFARPAIVLADFVAAIHTPATATGMTYLRAVDEDPTVMTGADCELDLPSCGSGSAKPAEIQAPCERFGTCVDPVEETKKATDIDTDSGCITAAFLLAAAAYA
jgi:iron complex transport system substrate-binding protein